MMKSLAVFALVAFLHTCPCGAAEVPDVKALLNKVSGGSGQSVLSTLTARKSVWDAARSRISSGDPNWIRLAIKLRLFSDAGITTALDDALTEALWRSPKVALMELREEELSRYCSVMLMEGSPYPDLKQTLKAADALKEKIVKISEASLKSKRDICVKYVDESKRDAINWFAN